MHLLLIVSAGLYFAFVLFIIAGLFRHNTLKVQSTDDVPFASVVIAARNEEANLPDLIQDLINQEYPMKQLEIIIVDDRSNDDTQLILSRAAQSYGFFHTIRIDEPSSDMTPKKHALSLGIEAAKGEVIISTDADCRVGPLWVSSMVYNVMESDGISIGYSKVDGDSFFQQYQQLDFLGIIAANAGAAGWGQYWSGTGQNLAYKKIHFDSVDGFQPVRDELSGDDMYLVQSISTKFNGFLNIDSNSFVTTAPVDSLNAFINQRTRWSSNAKKNLEQSPFFFTFLSVAFLCNTMILFALLMGNNWLSVFGMKFILEWIVLFLCGRLFETAISPIVYLVWAILQPLYIPFIGLKGLTNQFAWKP